MKRRRQALSVKGVVSPLIMIGRIQDESSRHAPLSAMTVYFLSIHPGMWNPKILVRMEMKKNGFPGSRE